MAVPMMIEPTLNQSAANQIASRVEDIFQDAGQQAGRAMSAGLATGAQAGGEAVQQMARDAQTAYARINESQEETRRLQQQLDDMTASGARGIEVQAERVRRARQQETAAVREATDAYERYERAARDAASGASQSVSSAMDDAASEASSSGDEAGGAFMGGFGAAIRGLGTKAGPIGAALAASALVAFQAGSTLAAEMQAGFEREAGRDLFQARTGLSDADTARFAQLQGSIYANNFGESMGDVELATRTSLQQGLIDPTMTDAAAQEIVQTVIGMNDLIEGDIEQTANVIRTLWTSGVVPDIQSAADAIAFGERAGLGDDILDSLGEYSVGWQNVGLSVEQALVLIDQAKGLGVDMSDRTADALREMGRRVAEEPQKIVEALNNVGLDGVTLWQDLAMGGEQGFAAFDTIMDKIRSIEDPVLRKNTAQTLLGDTSGDFIAAFSQLDPSAALSSISQIEGAAQNAISTMGTNVAGTWDGMMRSIQVGQAEFGDALAQGFGPMINDLASWVTENKESIANFFAESGAAAVGFGAMVASGGAAALSAVSVIQAGIGDMAGWMLDIVETGLQGIATALDALPGDFVPEGWVSGVRTAQEAIGSISETAHGAGTSTQGLADDLGVMATQLSATALDLHTFSADFDLLGSAIQTLPDGKSFVLETNSPEIRAELERLGFTIETMPDGTVRVTAATEEAQNTLNAFVASNDNLVIGIQLRLGVNQFNADFQRWIREFQSGNTNPGPLPYLPDYVAPTAPSASTAAPATQVFGRRTRRPSPRPARVRPCTTLRSTPSIRFRSGRSRVRSGTPRGWPSTRELWCRRRSHRRICLPQSRRWSIRASVSSSPANAYWTWKLRAPRRRPNSSRRVMVCSSPSVNTSRPCRNWHWPSRACRLT